MRRLGEKIEEYNDYILFHKGEVAGQRGLGFIIKRSMKKHIQELTGISDRIAILNISISGYKKLWSIIQIYAPTEKATKTEQHSKETIKKIKQSLIESAVELTVNNIYA